VEGDLLLLDSQGRQNGSFSSGFSSGFDVPSTYMAAVLADLPIGYWRLGEPSGTNAVDDSGYAHDGTYTLGPVVNQTGLVAQNNGDPSVAFDGSNDYVDIPSALSLKPSRWSIEAWVKVTGGDTIMGTVFADEYNGSSVSYVLDAFDGAGHTLKPSVGFYNGSWRIAQSATPLSAGTIYHLVGTWDGTVLRIYVNGSQVATNTPGSSPTAGNVLNPRIGTRWDNSGDGQKFHGNLDEVALYDYALAPSQISNHYTIGSTTGDATATPSTVVGVGAIPAPAAKGNATALPSATVGTGAVPAAAAQGAATATPSATAGIGLVPVATAFSGTAGNAAPSTVVGTGLVPAPTATGVVNGTGTPTATVGIGAVPAPTVSGRATGLPSATAGIGAAPSPTAKGNSSTVPARVVGVAAVSAAVVTGGGAGRPSAVVGTARVPHVHALGQGTGGGGGSPNGATDFWAIKLGV
jgi:hypothetical protein